MKYRFVILTLNLKRTEFLPRMHGEKHKRHLSSANPWKLIHGFMLITFKLKPYQFLT